MMLYEKERTIFRLNTTRREQQRSTFMGCGQSMF